MSKDMVLVLAILGVGGAFLFMQSQKAAMAGSQNQGDSPANNKSGGSQSLAPQGTFNDVAGAIGALFAGFKEVANTFNERN